MPGGTADPAAHPCNLVNLIMYIPRYITHVRPLSYQSASKSLLFHYWQFECSNKLGRQRRAFFPDRCKTSCTCPLPIKHGLSYKYKTKQMNFIPGTYVALNPCNLSYHELLNYKVERIQSLSLGAEGMSFSSGAGLDPSGFQDPFPGCSFMHVLSCKF